MNSRNRTKFETFSHPQEYVPYVQLKGMDKSGNAIRDSGKIETILRSHLSDGVESDGDIVDEQGRGGGGSSRLSVQSIISLTLGCILGADIVLPACVVVLRSPWAARVRAMLGRKKATQCNKIGLEELGTEQSSKSCRAIATH